MSNPCRNCVYFSICGSTTRIMFCAGRKTKSEVKKDEKHKSNKKTREQS